MDPMSLSGHGRQARRGGRRRCLLKDCERWFQPTHPQCRYCSAACRSAARRWRRWHAQQKYRSSANGRAHRQQQARRYRQRCRRRPSPVGMASAAASSAAVLPDRDATPRAGKRAVEKKQNIPLCPCDRPGCYVLFAAGRPPQRRLFCCALCRNALRCVRQREARWRQRRRRGLQPVGRRRRPRARSP
jgi:hypothetical protein